MLHSLYALCIFPLLKLWTSHFSGLRTCMALQVESMPASSLSPMSPIYLTDSGWISAHLKLQADQMKTHGPNAAQSILLSLIAITVGL